MNLKIMQKYYDLLDFFIIWILIDLYNKNLKDLKWFYKFIRFKRIIWIFKNTFKITHVSGKNNKNDDVWIKKSTTKIIFLMF